jgi:thermitase
MADRKSADSIAGVVLRTPTGYLLQAKNDYGRGRLKNAARAFRHYLAVSLGLIVLAAAALDSSPRPAFAGTNPPVDTVLVSFKSTANERAIAALNKTLGTKDIDGIPELSVRLLRVPSGQSAKSVAERLARNPIVEFAEPNSSVALTDTGSDPYLTAGWQWDLNLVQAPQAWGLSTGSSQISIAILDTGIDMSHPDLAGKVIASVNFTGTPTLSDVYGHGTSVAGIAAAATNNAVGVAGIGYNSSILNVKVMDDTGYGTLATVAKGISWAINHDARVINLSLGGYSSSKTLQRAIDSAWKQGIIMVAAAGNNGSGSPFYPAAYANVIAVASTQTNDTLPSYSNYGSWVDIAAPGGPIWTTTKNSGFGYVDGTSMASPHVAGLAALALASAADKNKNGRVNDDVRSCLQATADDVGLTLIPGGRINAYKAVECSIGQSSP